MTCPCKNFVAGPDGIVYFDLLGVHVSEVNLNLAVNKILEWIKDRKRTYVCVAPVSTVVDCQDDGRYLDVVNAAGMITPDGMPLVWMGRWRGSQLIDRTYGPELMEEVIKEGLAKGLKHFFYGGSDRSLPALIENLKKRFPLVHIVGQHAPGVIAIGQKEDNTVIQEINNTRPDVLWVGLGSPKQDYWMSVHRPLLDVPVIVGAGAAFDFLAGTKPQAPRWIQRSGTEWLFRLLCEPRRLWKRYLWGNTRFVWLLLKDAWIKRDEVK